MDRLDHIDDQVAAYLRTQRLGRLATVDANGAPQNNPVTFRFRPELGAVDIGGYRMGQSRKFRNVQGNPHIAFVVDDLFSLQPWVVRCVEIRGTAQALTDEDPPMPSMSREVIRIHPTRVFVFGLDG
jgi:pyridoxamine 5'-phosphate oxidase family protein